MVSYTSSERDGENSQSDISNKEQQKTFNDNDNGQIGASNSSDLMFFGSQLNT